MVVEYVAALRTNVIVGCSEPRDRLIGGDERDDGDWIRRVDPDGELPDGRSVTSHTACRESLDDYHGSTTTRTGMRRLLAGCGSFLPQASSRLALWQQSTRGLVPASQPWCRSSPAGRSGDAVKALGKHAVEAPDELGGRQRHGLVASRPFDPIVLVAERDASLVGLDSAGCWRWDAMGVAGEVRENLLSSGNGDLA